MPLFDELQIHPNHLPEKAKKLDGMWQTKSLECQMDQYLIDVKGKLWKTTKSLDSWKKVKVKEPYGYYGEIHFYRSKEGELIEFKAWIINGKLKELIEI